MLIGLELFMGIIVGFIVCDNQKGFSITEIKVSSLLFILSNAFVFWKNPDVKAIIFSHLAISWFILMIGVYLGEKIKMHLINSYLAKMQKDKIIVKTNELVRVNVSNSYLGTEVKDNVNREHQVLHSLLEILKEYLKQTKQDDLIIKVNQFQNLVQSYQDLSVQIWQEIEDGNVRPERIHLWVQVGQELITTCEFLLENTQEIVQKYIGKEFSLDILTQLIKVNYVGR